MGVKGLVLDIDRFSTHDGPGIRTAVFLKGCPLRCRWCHSPESQSPEPELLYRHARCIGCGRCAAACPHGAITHDGEVLEDAITRGITVHRDRCRRCYHCTTVCPTGALLRGGTLWDAQELADSLIPEIPFFRNSSGGVTVTGGEPLLQAEFTLEFLRACGKLGIHTLLETCGCGDREQLREIARHCSTIYYDVKLLDPEEHRYWTGHSNENILAALEDLCRDRATAGKILVRVPCIPGVNDSPEHIRQVAALVRSLGIPAMQLLPYNPMAGEKYGWVGQDYPMPPGLEPRDAAYYRALDRLVEEAGLRAGY